VAAFQGWERAVLAGIGAPPTADNVKLLDAWQRAEGGDASYNPLNTTQDAADAYAYNSVGVRNYPSAKVGTAATVKTLLNGYYSGIVGDLRSGIYRAPAIVDRNVSEFGTWGTGASSIAGVLGSRFSGSSSVGRTRPDTGAATSGGSGIGAFIGGLGGDVTSAAGAAWKDALGVISGPVDVVKAALWLLDPASWLRMVEFLTGMVLMLLGLTGLAVVFVQRSGLVGDAAGLAAAFPGPVGTAGKAVTAVHRPRQAMRGAATKRKAAASRDELAQRRATREQERTQRQAQQRARRPVRVMGERYASGDEARRAAADLERQAGDTPEYGPQRRQLEEHARRLRQAAGDE
jgi:hypothetical protein